MNNKPKAIKVIGTLCIIFSSMAIFSNLMGIMSYYLIGFGEGTNPDEFNSKHYDPVNYVLYYYVEFCIFMIILAIGYLIAGINFRKYKWWANRLIVLLSSVALSVFCLVFGIFTLSAIQSQNPSLAVIPILLGLLFSVPLILLIRYIKKPAIRMHFEKSSE